MRYRSLCRQALSWMTGLVLICLVMSGCATRPDTRLLDVSLIDIRQVPSQTGAWGEVQLACTLRIDNGSPVALPFGGSAHDITINGKRLGQALSDNAVVIPRLGSETITVNLYLNALRTTQALYRMYQDQNLQYEIQSTLYPGSQGSLSGRGWRVKTAGTLDPAQFNLFQGGDNRVTY
jgi:LEA14-like dessication related protein